MPAHSNRLQNLALATIFGLVYYVVFWFQVQWLGNFDFVQGVSLLFLPAGIKMLAIVVGGLWGTAGVLLASVLLSHVVWGEQGMLYALMAQIVWAGTPYLTYQVLKRQLAIDDMLLSLKGTHIVLIAVVTSLASSLADRSFRYLAGNVDTHNFNSAVWGMMLGDIGGIVLVLSLTVVVIQQLRTAQR